MTAPFSHQDRAAEAARHAQRLQADLGEASRMLNRYRDDGLFNGVLEHSRQCQEQLGSFVARIGALDPSGDERGYALSDAEHVALQSAEALRADILSSLAHRQQVELNSLKLRDNT